MCVFDVARWCENVGAMQKDRMSKKATRAPVYQLSATSPHDAFVGFDNSPCARAGDRIVVVFTIRKLPAAENKVVTSVIRDMHGHGALGLRSDGSSRSEPTRGPVDAAPLLEFMKYVIVYTEGSASGRGRSMSIKDVVDLDCCRKMRPPIGMGLRKALKSCKMVPMDSGTLVSTIDDAKPLRFGASVHEGSVPREQVTLSYDTASHGVVKLKLSRYADPDVRTGIEISVQRNLSKRSCWGSLVTASKPKDVRLRKMTDVPPRATPDQAEAYNDLSYYSVKELEADYDGEKHKAKMYVPKHKKSGTRIR